MTQISASLGRAAQRSTVAQPSLRHYAVVSFALACLGVALYGLTRWMPRTVPAPGALLGPIFALVALMAVVCLLMVTFRNYAVLRGIAKVVYYTEYRSEAPPDWVERPARTFDNLMQIPNLFWLVCALMMITRELDAAQVALAWVFVATRVVHAVVYLVWNHIPARFGAWTAGVLVLGVIWGRFALQSWHLLG